MHLGSSNHQIINVSYYQQFMLLFVHIIVTVCYSSCQLYPHIVAMRSVLGPHSMKRMCTRGFKSSTGLRVSIQYSQHLMRYILSCDFYSVIIGIHKLSMGLNSTQYSRTLVTRPIKIRMSNLLSFSRHQFLTGQGLRVGGVPCKDVIHDLSPHQLFTAC